MAAENQFYQIVNRVLVQVGQGHDQITSSDGALTDRYHLKVAAMCNDIIAEVEEAADWRTLRTRDTATVSANGISATLTSSTERSRVFREITPQNPDAVALCYDVTDGSNQIRLREMDLAQLLRLDQGNNNLVDGTQPVWFALQPDSAGTGMDIYTWPRCATNRSIEIDMIIPQARLPVASQANLEVVVKVPHGIVYAGTYWKALLDRDGATPESSRAFDKYDALLAGGVAAEMSAAGMDELIPT